MAEQMDQRWFTREDPSPDPDFYAEPRFTVHIDEWAIEAVTDAYRNLLPAGGKILDLMSSWRSHLPVDVSFSYVVGLGMNAEEMADNPQLCDYVVQDLNAGPDRLPFEDEEFDGAVVTVSVQYLTRPVHTFGEVWRVLKPGAPLVVTYSNRCFPTKAVRAWLATNETQHANLIASYFNSSGGWSTVNALDATRRTEGQYRDPLYVVWAHKAPRPAIEANPAT